MLMLMMLVLLDLESELVVEQLSEIQVMALMLMMLVDYADDEHDSTFNTIRYAKEKGYYLCNHCLSHCDARGKKCGSPIPLGTLHCSLLPPSSPSSSSPSSLHESPTTNSVTDSEEDIFRMLGLQYILPEHRDW